MDITINDIQNRLARLPQNLRDNVIKAIEEAERQAGIIKKIYTNTDTGETPDFYDNEADSEAEIQTILSARTISNRENF